MNSVLQQLYMNKMFRDGIMEIEVAEQEKNLLYQLQILFAALSEKSAGALNARDLCKCIKDFDGKPISIREQRDVDEFFNLLMDRLEPFLPKAKAGDLIKKTFGGSFANEVICLECPHRSENIESFLSLNLQIAGKKSIKESLEAFVSEEYLTGQDLYYCERCDKKMKAKRRTTFKTLPNYFAIFLKRFDYQHRTGYLPQSQSSRKAKLNDYCEFALELDMELFTEEFHAKEDIRRSSYEGSNLLKKEESALLNFSLPGDYYRYRLKGVILHNGTAEGGHYISLIRSKDIWYEFNDARVTRFNMARLAEDCFGGVGKAFGNVQKGFEKRKNAYLLVYERATHYDMNQVDLLSKEISTSQDMKRLSMKFERAKFKDLKANVMVSQVIQVDAAERIRRNKLRQTIFSADFLRFISHVVLGYTPQGSESDVYAGLSSVQGNLGEVEGVGKDDAARVETWKFFVHFMFTVLFRTKHETIAPLNMLLKKLKSGLSSDMSFSVWFADTFTHQEIVREFFIDNPTSATRFFTGSLLTAACSKLSHTKHHALTATIVDNFLKLLGEAAAIPKVFRDMTFVLCVLARDVPRVAVQLVERGVIGFCFERLLDLPGSCFGLLKLICVPAAKEAPSLRVQRESASKKKGNGMVMRGNAKSLRFLFYLLSQLLDKVEIAKSGLNSDRTDYEDLATNEEKWELLFSKVDTDIARTSISNIFVKLLSSNKDWTMRFVSFLWVMIYKSDCTSLPTYVLAMKDIILSKTSYDEQKLKGFLKYSNTVIKKFLENSYIAYNYVIDLFIELSLKSSEFLELFKSNENKQLLMKWLSANACPNKKSVAWIEGPKLKIEISKPVSEEDKKLCKEYSSLRLKAIKSLDDASVLKDAKFLGERVKNLLEVRSEEQIKSFDIK